VAPRKDPLPMFPPEIGRPEKPRPPTGAYPSQILGIIALGPPFPKFFGESFFSGVLGFLDARRGGAGPSPLYGPNFLTIRLPKFFGIKNRVPSLGRVLHKSAFCKRGSVNVRFAPKAAEVLRCRELTRCAKRRHSAALLELPGVLRHWTRLLAGRAYGLPMVTTLAAATGRD